MYEQHGEWSGYEIHKSSEITNDIAQSADGSIYATIGGITYYWVHADHDVDY